jgi:hypothetical protein
MTMALRRHARLLIAAALLGGAAGAIAQPPPSDNPLPSGAEIRPYGKPADERPSGDERVPGLDERQKARDAFIEFLRAYETGNLVLLQQRLDPAMVGYQVFLEGARRDANALKNLRINLVDTQITASADLAVIQTSWEKRFLEVNTFAPGLFTGRSTILMHKGKEGWRVAAVAGDNLFSSASGTAATLTLSPSVIVPPPGGCAVGACPPLRIEIVDPDFAGQPTIAAEVVTSQGDREQVTLLQTAPGRFSLASLPLAIGPGLTPAANNGVVTVNSLGGTTTLTLRFLDPNPGDGRPPSVLTRSAQVQGTAPTVAQLNVTPLLIPIGSIGATPTTVPLQIQVVDPDRAGQPSVTVQALSVSGDIETLTLPATTPGVFQVNAVLMLLLSAVPTPGNGIIEVPNNPIGNTLNLQFTDNNPPGIQTRIVTIQ